MSRELTIDGYQFTFDRRTGVYNVCHSDGRKMEIPIGPISHALTVLIIEVHHLNNEIGKRDEVLSLLEEEEYQQIGSSTERHDILAYLRFLKKTTGTIEILNVLLDDVINFIEGRGMVSTISLNEVRVTNEVYNMALKKLEERVSKSVHYKLIEDIRKIIKEALGKESRFYRLEKEEKGTAELIVPIRMLEGSN